MVKTQIDRQTDTIIITGDYKYFTRERVNSCMLFQTGISRVRNNCRRSAALVLGSGLALSGWQMDAVKQGSHITIFF